MRRVPESLSHSRLASWAKGSWPYQVFVVRALQRGTSRAWCIVSFCFLLFAVSDYVDYLNTVPDMGGLTRQEGVVERINEGRGRARRSIVMDVDDGDPVRYFGAIPLGENGEKIIGEPVTVWLHRKISVFGPSTRVYHLEFEGETLVNYEEIRPRLEASQERLPRFVIWWLVLGVIPLMRVWWVNRIID